MSENNQNQGSESISYSSPFEAIQRQPPIQLSNLETFLQSNRIQYAELQRTYAQNFLKKTRDFDILVRVFKDQKLLEMISQFAALVVVNFSEKSLPEKPELAQKLTLKIQLAYKVLVHKLVGQDLRCFSVAIFIGFNVMQHLIRMRLFDKKTESFEFMNYCVELAHYQLNGFKLNSNALAKYVDAFFGKYYKDKSKSRSVNNIALPQNVYEDSMMAFEAECGEEDRPVTIRGASLIKPDGISRAELIELKLSELNGGYNEIKEDFVKLMRAFVEKKHTNNEVDRQIPEIEVQANPEAATRKNVININSISLAMQQTTLSCKKQFFVSIMNRFPGPFARRQSWPRRGCGRRKESFRPQYERYREVGQFELQKRGDFLCGNKRRAHKQPQRPHKQDFQAEIRKVLQLRKEDSRF